MNTTTPPTAANFFNQDPLALDPDVVPQIEALSLVRGRPLIVTDCDEVLMQFLVGLETYIETQGLWLDLKSYALTGNIKRRDTNEHALPCCCEQRPEGRCRQNARRYGRCTDFLSRRYSTQHRLCRQGS